MVELENRHWQEIEHTPYMLPYTGLLIVRSLTDERLNDDDELEAARVLTESIGTGIQQARVEADPDVALVSLGLKLEAESDFLAFEHICRHAVEAWAHTGHDIEDLVFMDAYLVYAPELAEDQHEDPDLTVGSKRYQLEQVEKIEEIDNELEIIELPVSDIFYQVRDELAA